MNSTRRRAFLFLKWFVTAPAISKTLSGVRRIVIVDWDILRVPEPEHQR